MSCCGTPLTPEESSAVGRLVAEKLSAFLRTLRDNGFSVGLGEGRDAAALMAAGYAERPGLLRSALKHLFSARRSEWERFDGIFDAFWLGKRVRSRNAVSGHAGPGLKALEGGGAKAGAVSDQAPADGGEGAGSGESRMEGASAVETLSGIDLRKLSDPADVARAHDIAADLARAMRTRLTRRDLARRRGYRIDLRRTIHGNIGHGGVPLDLVRRRRKEKPLRLVMLLDASGSMTPYTGLLLRFMHGVLDAFRESEAFLFHTRLAMSPTP